MRLPDSLVKQSARVFGQPPPKEAPRIDTWIYVRTIYTRLLPFLALVWIVVALAGEPTWLWILFGISTVTWLQGFVSVNLRIRRLRNSRPDG